VLQWTFVGNIGTDVFLRHWFFKFINWLYDYIPEITSYGTMVAHNYEFLAPSQNIQTSQCDGIWRYEKESRSPDFGLSLTLANCELRFPDDMLRVNATGIDLLGAPISQDGDLCAEFVLKRVRRIDAFLKLR
jgi:hypothetical protein